MEENSIDNFDLIREKLQGLNVTPDEEYTMRFHNEFSRYKGAYMTRAWRDARGVLCVEYCIGEEKHLFHYNARGEWW